MGGHPMNYRLEWRLVGRASRLLDQGEIDEAFPDRTAALQALNAFLLTFAVRGRNEAVGYWWGRRSTDADIEVQVVLRHPVLPMSYAPAPFKLVASQEASSTPLSKSAHEERRMTFEERSLLHKAATDPTGQIALKRSRCGAWHADRDRLDAPARGGHLLALGERMGPHLGGTFALWQITPVGRALADDAGSAA